LTRHDGCSGELKLQITVLIGAVLQDFRDGRSGTFMDLGSTLSPALGGSPALALAAELLQAPELCPG
jgi:hypothetical protein